MRGNYIKDDISKDTILSFDIKEILEKSHMYNLNKTIKNIY